SVALAPASARSVARCPLATSTTASSGSIVRAEGSAAAGEPETMAMPKTRPGRRIAGSQRSCRWTMHGLREVRILRQDGGGGARKALTAAAERGLLGDRRRHA